MEKKKEDNNEHQTKIKVEEFAEDRYPVVLDVATGVGKEAMESHKGRYYHYNSQKHVVNLVGVGLSHKK